jgi:ssDNA-binding Zn-finger/Zn-ribbon topoisomerase 1
MIELIDARWATKEEVANHERFIKKTSKDKDLFTSDYLSKHGNEFIKLHERFIEDMTNEKKKQFKIEHTQDILKYDKDSKQYESLLGQRCVCKGDMRRVIMSDYEFIGCENYREQGFEHLRKYKPKMPVMPEYQINYIYEPSKQYLVKMRDFYNLPRDLKPSFLLEYLNMKEIKPLTDCSASLGLGKNNKSISDKRETIVKDLLSSKFDKLYFQKMMVLTYSDGTKQKRIPDLIGKKNNSLYIIEQKKYTYLIKESQTYNYYQAISLMLKKKKLDYDIKLIYIIEDGMTDLANNIINFKDLETYEFN